MTKHNRVEYPPFRRGSVRDQEFHHGVIVGVRTITHGEVLMEDGVNVSYVPIKGTARRVWLVSFDMHMNPVMCLDDQIESIETTVGRLTHGELG